MVVATFKLRCYTQAKASKRRLIYPHLNLPPLGGGKMERNSWPAATKLEMNSNATVARGLVPCGYQLQKEKITFGITS